MPKKILYIDMDGVLADEQSALIGISDQMRAKYADNLKDLPGIAGAMLPMTGAVQAVHDLAELFDIYVLSTARWTNASVWFDKVNWIKRYFGEDKPDPLYKKLILTNNKGLNKGDFLVDDNCKNGVDNFEGEWLPFGAKFVNEKFPNQPEFRDWQTVVEYLKIRA
ncbi:MAG: hypothetical protein LBM97_00225 [Candidatus Nomurabacteria bacterium]|jgi:5'(3')-deoxyribonucleotidase|nr:hypothetical protein [Candidatus Nomurabacteria bacterium]